MHTSDLVPTSARLTWQRTLRRLVALEIALAVLFVVVYALGLPTLPPALAEYEQSVADAAWGVRDWALLMTGLPWLVVYAVSLLALWRGWRFGRRLYAGLWAASLMLGLLMGPVVNTALIYMLETASTLVGGLILGLLYFSELRHDYDAPQR